MDWCFGFHRLEAEIAEEKSKQKTPGGASKGARALTEAERNYLEQVAPPQPPQP